MSPAPCKLPNPPAAFGQTRASPRTNGERSGSARFSPARCLVLPAGDRVLLRALGLCATRYVAAIDGLQHIGVARDPFILVANHSTLCEALLVPAMLMLHRGGSRVHFLADWNFRLIPGVGFLYARAEVVTVTRKSAKPRLLNVLKPLYRAAPADTGARQGAFGRRP